MNKQIEEMAKIIGENSWEDITPLDGYVCAEALYNAGCRLVDDIVEKVTVERPVMCDLLNEEQRELQKVLETRKESAREILQKVYDEFVFFTDDSIYEGGEIKDIIRTIAERNGVEVE